ncbi:UDP-glucose/GDP-mannose dehydrogenase family protein [Stagnimonas aquatica]|uniref:UDP-glucose 6-dehydrogenase n=2 Tax=Stagnimonas aquatica TaxID=2689987 RepID=A0A3N0UYN3_9GAMM|nr:UDP-glucose/GDP-mannose dehydrogenase family protein [Stagnimonas aquatica]ROH85593.1 UDP-glucose/GDP-mannose dehydrogenase family protein [Stagnimonas aquatica]
MNITIFGSGYVGLVTAVCFAEVGNDVLCVDVDERKVAMLRRGESPIYEPGLSELLKSNYEAGRIRFTTSAEEGAKHGLYQFIAVGTPPNEDGSADMKYVLAVAKSIGQYIDGYRVVISKSTVPVGTADRVRAAVAAELKARGASHEFDVVSNPEFLKEGAAIADFTKPDRIVVGSDSLRATEHMQQLYAPFNRNHDRVVVMDVRSSEMTKYAANAMLATKISFMNEMANLAEKLGADIEKVRIGIGSDPRIGYQFIYPGCGYGGSCFPKDVKALIHMAEEVGFEAAVLQGVEDVNNQQKGVLFEKISAHFGGDLAGKTIGLWGLAFKPRTDDMREAPSRNLMEALWAAGAKVRAYDPVAAHETHRIYGDRADLVYAKSPEDAAEGADALALVTEWKVFASPNFATLAKLLKQPVIFDGRNQYDPAYLKKAGFQYYSIGRKPA